MTEVMGDYVMTIDGTLVEVQLPASGGQIGAEQKLRQLLAKGEVGELQLTGGGRALVHWGRVGLVTVSDRPDDEEIHRSLSIPRRIR